MIQMGNADPRKKGMQHQKIGRIPASLLKHSEGHRCCYTDGLLFHPLNGPEDATVRFYLTDTIGTSDE